tara:strand:- start:340 stop:915 length:576 start_codon:yes stop_codon:yes gene_type:complete
MPTIDEKKLSKSKFVKTEVRSWDQDLLKTLLIKDDEPDTKKIFKKTSVEINNVLPELTAEKIKPVDKAEKRKQSNNLAQEKTGDNELDFLSDDFKYNKLLKKLSGNEQKVILLIIKICNKNGSSKTGLISGDDFDEHLGLKRNSRETALKRLCKKEILKRYTGKRGFGGFINLGMSDKVLEIANNFDWDAK